MKRLLYKAAVAVFMTAVLGCSSRIYDNSKNEPVLTVSINLSDASPKLLAAVDQFQVIVIDVAENDTVAVRPLLFNDSTFMIEGQIDTLPAEIDLLFIAEARDFSKGLIFRGSTNAILVPDIVNNVTIDLSPVVPLMKSTPRYNLLLGTDQSTHTIDIKLFNVDSLYGVSFRLFYDPTYVILTGARLDTSLNPTSVIFFQNDAVDSLGRSYKAITISNTIQNVPIVGSDSDVVLTNIDFILEQTFITPETTLITIEPTGMTHANQSTISPSILYIDETVVEITP
jgi:hypothetical protein